MGIFTGLLTLPLAPVRGVAWVADKVAAEADRQLYDESQIRAELLQLELDFDDGLIDEDERKSREDDLLDRLAVSQERAAMAREDDLDG
jgi:Gas vesicle protein G